MGFHFFRTTVTAVAQLILTRRMIIELVNRCIPIMLVRYQANTATVMPITVILTISSLLKLRIKLAMEDMHGNCTVQGE